MMMTLLQECLHSVIRLLQVSRYEITIKQDNICLLKAHTTQFTSPGWKYLKHSSGVGKLAEGGSFVTLTDPSAKSITIIIETMSHDHSKCIRPRLPEYSVTPQTAVFKLEGSFASVTSLNVWYSKLGFDGNPSILFEKRKPVQVVGGMVTLSVGVDEMWTLTTVSTGMKGSAPESPASKPFPLPYSDDFESYSQMNTEPYNLAQQIGVWEVFNVGAPHNNVIRQMVLDKPVAWCKAEKSNRTFSIIGSQNWTDIYVQSDVRVGSVNGSRGVFIGARINQGGCKARNAKGIYFIIYPGEKSYKLVNDLEGKKVLHFGSAKTLPDWNNIALLISRGKVTAILNSVPLFSIHAPASPTSGFVGIGTEPYGIAEFDNFEILSASEGAKRMRPRAQEYNPDTLYFRTHFDDKYSEP